MQGSVPADTASEMEQIFPPHLSSRNPLSTITAPPLLAEGDGNVDAGNLCLLSPPHPLPPHTTVRNTSGCRHNDDTLPSASSVDSGSSSLAGNHENEQESIIGSEPERHVPNSDSGIQTHFEF